MTPTPPSPAPLTPEQMLEAVIEAQVKGGCGTFEHLLMPRNHERFECGWTFNENSDAKYWHCNYYEGLPTYHVLEILLDPQGLWAAYGEEEKFYSFDGIHATGETLWKGKWVARTILNAWLPKPEGDAEAAIRTAYDLLPKP